MAQAAKIYYYLNNDNIAHGLWYRSEIDELIAEAEERETELPVLPIKVHIVRQLVEMFDSMGVVRDKNKLGNLLMNREKRESTGIKHGVAFPHVRTDHVREFAMAMIITDKPVPFESLGGYRVSLIISMVTPTYDDNLHLKILAKLSEFLQFETFVNDLLATNTAGEVIRLFKMEE
jgi:PTS system nitrogen regulatory IIA component